MEATAIIRKCRAEDYADLSDLASQLGYPCEAEEVKKRIERYLCGEDRAIIVAEIEGNVVGWASLDVVDHFYLEPFVEISGFIVDRDHRSLGIGKRIMDEIEAWTKERGYALLRLKTNIKRKDSHRFYERLGFERTKEQFVYAKKIR
jgi:GNAT superfamily N-acetyltransferase